MAYFEHTYNGSVTKFGTSKPDVYMYMRIYGNTYPEARYLEYYVTLGCYYAYRSAWTWKDTNFVVGGYDHLNGTDLAFNANGGATDLKTVGPFRVNYGLDGNAGSVQLWGRLYNGSVKNVNNGKYYSLDTRLESVWYPFPWIAAAVPPGRPSSQLVNGATSATVNERSDKFTLTWNHPSNGTFGVSGYRVYCSRGTGWKKIGETTNHSFETSIQSIQSTVYDGGTMPRGHSVGFYIQAYNNYLDSGYTGGVFDYNSLTLANVSGSCSSSEKTCTSAKISWNSNINIKTVEYRKSSSDKWVTVQSGLNTKSSSFTITGLTFNTKYTVEVRVTAVSDNAQAIFSTTVTTLDIAKITAVTKEWSVEATGEITATNPGGCALQLYLDYYTNNTWVPLISRPKIELVDSKYTLTLTRDEINILYKQASGKSDARFRFTLKSYYPNYLGEHSMETKITFPTKAWVKPEGTTEWKRALVWARDSATSPWKQVSPWVDPTNNKNWKRI